MKIITAKQSRFLDQETMKREPISSLDLMERAGHLLYQKIEERFGIEKNYFIFCGNGNNGGDGLVIARKLVEKGAKVMVFIDKKATHRSAENKKNIERIKNLKIQLFDFLELNEISKSISSPVIIDALFGVGLNRPLENTWADRIREINALSGEKVAIDLPSGLIADSLIGKSSAVFKADVTYTIGQPKITFLLPETGVFVGHLEVVDIGLNLKVLDELETPFFYINQNFVRKNYHIRNRFSHKGTYGHALIIAGSYGKIGAGVLTTKAVLKSGAGLVTTYLPKCGYEILQSTVPEAMCLTDEHEYKITSFPEVENYNSIGIGTGLGTDEDTQKAFFEWLKNTDLKNKKLVVDADALNILSKNKSMLNYLPPNTIITPHPKEFERLVGSFNDSFERLELAKNLAKNYQLVVILKDAVTSIISPTGHVYFNSNGNAGLATGGSGDTLTGIVVGLLAQGYTPLVASQLGVWLHGKSADLAMNEESMESFIASQINHYLGKAFLSLTK